MSLMKARQFLPFADSSRYVRKCGPTSLECGHDGLCVGPADRHLREMLLCKLRDGVVNQYTDSVIVQNDLVKFAGM